MVHGPWYVLSRWGSGTNLDPTGSYLPGKFYWHTLESIIHKGYANIILVFKLNLGDDPDDSRRPSHDYFTVIYSSAIDPRSQGLFHHLDHCGNASTMVHLILSPWSLCYPPTEPPLDVSTLCIRMHLSAYLALV